MNQKQSIKLVREAFDALHILNNHGWQNYREVLLAECVSEEKSHRGCLLEFRQFHPWAASLTDCAKSFAVSRIAQYLTGTKPPAGKDYLHTQQSCFFAAGLVDEFGAEIRQAWAGLDVGVIAAVDYVTLVSPDKANQKAA